MTSYMLRTISEERPLDRREFVVGLGAVVAMPAIAQTKAATPRVGLLWLGTGGSASLRDALIAGLKRRGYEDGRNIAVIDRTGLREYRELQPAAKELVDSKVDVIVSYGATAPHAVHEATSTIPIVMIGTDPDRRGLVQSLSRPGGNITGIATLASELMQKRIEVFRECVAFTHLAALVHRESEGSMSILPTIESEARRLKFQLKILEVRKPEDFEQAIAGAAKGNAKALLSVPSTMLNAYTKQIAQLAIKHKLPMMGSTPESVDAGALVTYSPDFEKLFDRAAEYVVRILKGSNPATMAIEQPSEFVLAINLKTAAAIGLKIPEAMRFRATKIVQ